MAAIDAASLLEPVSEEAPCGENLEYDDAFIELETVIRGKPEREEAANKVEAEEPDWPAAEGLALDLCGRTKDLRVAAHLLRTQIKTSGWPGFAATLDLIRGYLVQYWDTVYPQLDPEDDNDPIGRLNALAALSDNDTVLRDVRMTPLTQSRQLGRFGLRDYLIATGAMAAAPGAPTPPDVATIEGAFKDTSDEELQETAAAIKASLEHVNAIDEALDGVLGSANTADVKPLRKMLQEIGKLLDQQAGDRLGAPDGESAFGDLGEEDGGEDAAAPARGRRSGGGGGSGDIATRDDVLAALDRICDYYAQNEPASPVPLLLQRAKRLVPMSFMEILRDMSPDGVNQAALIAGIAAEPPAEE